VTCALRRATGIVPVWFLLGLGSAHLAGAGDFSVKPILSAGVGYDSNIFYQPSDPTDDYFGSVAVRVPVEYKISPHSGLTASYLGSGEWYRDLTQLDRFPTRQLGSLDYSYGSGRSLSLGLGGFYSESQRAEDVFPESGVQFRRGRARSAGGRASLSRKLTRREDLALTYNYGRSLYQDDQRADSHTGTASIARRISHDSRLDVRYLVQRYSFAADAGRDTSQSVTAGWSQRLWRNNSLKLRAGGRFVGGTTRPELEASLAHEWRRSTLTASYSRTRTFVPTSDRFGDTDRADLAFTHQTRSFRFVASSAYYRTRSEARDTDYESVVGRVDAVYMMTRWLGLGATYRYTYQRPKEAAAIATTRHVGQFGFVVAPWGAQEPHGLP
jgi:Putative beta-barrel porin 2